ncbi:MAG TPA: (2Fe-2S)-binding protein [Thermoleophilaceae bacterium]|jgi:aerobic-type carbon monoxide dehydrogenase small subunit (CoxS/CutS family)|nr:(2Fe-2S)-binding protein [Thermoleophilaceae bacterium]
MIVALLLNGRRAELETASADTLLETLRREGLLSVRATCGIGVCGACTVLLDGAPVSGCLMLTAQAAGREVTTVEGLAPDDPVPAAFSEARALQCGYCTPGMVLTASSLLRELPRPSDDEIAEALGGNLCRCGCYVKIAEAVRKAAA